MCRCGSCRTVCGGPARCAVPEGATVAGIRFRGTRADQHRAALDRRLRGPRPGRRRVHRAGLDRPHAARVTSASAAAAARSPSCSSSRAPIRPRRRSPGARPTTRRSRRSSPAPAGAPTSRSSAARRSSSTASASCSCTTRPPRRATAPPTCPSLIRGFYRFHVLSRGWFDIGYNYLVDRYGRIYEGRSGGITNNVAAPRWPASTPARPGVALIGNYSSVSPTDAAAGRPARRDRVAPRPRARRPAQHLAPDLRRRRPLRAGRGGGREGHLRASRCRLHRLPRHRHVPQAAGAPRRDRCAAAAAHLRPRGRAGRHRSDVRPAADPLHGAAVVGVALAGLRGGCRRRARGAVDRLGHGRRRDLDRPRADLADRPALAHRGGHRPRGDRGVRRPRLGAVARRRSAVRASPAPRPATSPWPTR